MPRSRGSEMPQRQSPRRPHQLRTSSSDSDPPHHRPIADRSPKIGDRRSPRGASHSDPVNQKKLGTRIADLESQLGQAQEELKSLKDQLASAEAAKKEAQEKLEKKTKKPEVPGTIEVVEQHSLPGIQESETTKNDPKDEVAEENQPETDVFEISVEKTTVESKVEFSQQKFEEEKETKSINVSTEPLANPQPEKVSIHELTLAKDEINFLQNKLDEKEKQLEGMGQENESLKKQLNEASWNISTAQKERGEMTQSLNKLREELRASKAEAIQLKEKLEAAEGAKEALETEMKKLRVQTEQWRKAADAAASILAGGVEMNGRIPERCGSMDKHFGGVFEPLAGGYAGFVGSPGMADDLDDGFASGKRKGSGIKMFGDLWKKKGHK